jgi:hypothetical protein
MVGVQMARHWHIVQNEMGILIFTQYPLMEEKKRLTISDGLDDGPDYSSDGKYIYFFLQNWTYADMENAIGWD